MPNMREIRDARRAASQVQAQTKGMPADQALQAAEARNVSIEHEASIAKVLDQNMSVEDYEVKRQEWKSLAERYEKDRSGGLVAPGKLYQQKVYDRVDRSATRRTFTLSPAQVIYEGMAGGMSFEDASHPDFIDWGTRYVVPGEVYARASGNRVVSELDLNDGGKAPLITYTSQAMAAMGGGGPLQGPRGTIYAVPTATGAANPEFPMTDSGTLMERVAASSEGSDTTKTHAGLGTPHLNPVGERDGYSYFAQDRAQTFVESEAWALNGFFAIADIVTLGATSGAHLAWSAVSNAHLADMGDISWEDAFLNVGQQYLTPKIIGQFDSMAGQALATGTLTAGFDMARGSSLEDALRHGATTGLTSFASDLVSPYVGDYVEKITSSEVVANLAITSSDIGVSYAVDSIINGESSKRNGITQSLLFGFLGNKFKSSRGQKLSEDASDKTFTNRVSDDYNLARTEMTNFGGTVKDAVTDPVGTVRQVARDFTPAHRFLTGAGGKKYEEADK